MSLRRTLETRVPERLPGGDVEPRGALDAERLAERARAGDERAFAQLVAAHGSSVVALCYASTLDRAEAEDLAQEVFLAAWRGLRRFRSEASFSTWLYSIARNAC